MGGYCNSSVRDNESILGELERRDVSESGTMKDIGNRFNRRQGQERNRR